MWWQWQLGNSPMELLSLQSPSKGAATVRRLKMSFIYTKILLNLKWTAVQKKEISNCD